MIIDFETLCNELHLSSTLDNEATLHVLIAWCHEHISQDRRFTGELETQYTNYLAMTESYLEQFLPNCPHNLAMPIEQFRGANAIQYAAQCGYDRFISQQSSIPADAINAKNKHKMTALHLSASYGYLHTAKALVRQGADVRQKNQRGESPLHSALFLPKLHDNQLILTKREIFNILIKEAPDSWTTDGSSNETVHHFMTK